MNNFLVAAKKPVLRREKVTVPVKTAPTGGASPQTGPRRPGPPANRFALTPSGYSKQTKNIAQRAVAPSRGIKRKSATPQPAGPLFSDDEDDDGSSEIGGSDSDASRKRIKSSVSSVESTGPKRTFASETVREDGKALKFVHGYSLTSRGQEKKYRNVFGRDETTTVSLQYPSNSPMERFQLKWPKSDVDYKPMEDIIETVQHICEFYLPDDLRRKTTDPEDQESFNRLFKRAWGCESVEDFEDTVHDFNKLIKPLL